MPLNSDTTKQRINVSDKNFSQNFQLIEVLGELSFAFLKIVLLFDVGVASMWRENGCIHNDTLRNIFDMNSKSSANFWVLNFTTCDPKFWSHRALEATNIIIKKIILNQRWVAPSDSQWRVSSIPN